ncbi:hypothetical protein BH10ACI2_BH10ACI2_11810 [soil metagenome]
MNKFTKKDCPFADEIVSYIYDEFGGQEQTAFEDHLADCMKCTDEFAAVSEARFSVFEWQREEFAPLATPRIVIPYETQTASWFDGVKAFLAGSMWPVGVAASLLLIAGFAFVLTNRTSEVATGVNTGVTTPAPKIVAPSTQVELANNTIPQVVASKDEKVTKASTTVTKANLEGRPVRAKALQTVRPSRLLTAEAVRTETTGVDPKKQLRKAPALSNFDEDDDNSLRLADLFDEGGV